MSCLDPPLTAVPPGMWLCPKCKVSTIPGFKIVVHSCSKTPCKRTQHCWMLHVASVCTPCCMLFRVVRSCCAKFKTGQTLCQQLQIFLLYRDRRSVAQQCWMRLHSSSKTVGATLACLTWSLWRQEVLWIVSFPRCTAGPNTVESCCVRLHAA